MEAKDKIQYSMSVLLIVAAIALAFTSFLITLAIGTGVLSAMALFLSSALAIIKDSLRPIERISYMIIKNFIRKRDE